MLLFMMKSGEFLFMMTGMRVCFGEGTIVCFVLSF